MVHISDYLVLSALLFSIGAVGALARRNALIILMCVELMLNAVNLAFVAFAFQLNNISGQVIAFFSITVAAAEAAVGLAIVMAIFRDKESVDVDTISLMKW